jgi:hypothetical protein
MTVFRPVRCGTRNSLKLVELSDKVFEVIAWHGVILALAVAVSSLPEAHGATS